MAAAIPFKDYNFKQQDSEGAVIDHQRRMREYRQYEQGLNQKGPTPGTKAPARGAIGGATPAPGGAVTPLPGVSGGAIPATPTSPTPGVPAGGAPAAAGTATSAATSGGFNLKTPWVKRSKANESKGEFGSESFEAKYNKIANQLVGIYNEQMPLLRNYDQMVQTQIDQLIGETMPQVQELFRQSGEQYGYAKEFYESAKGYDTPERRETARGEAMADVRMAGEASRNQAIETLESFGIDPSQARGAALDQNLRLQTALEQARAGTKAEQDVEKLGRDYTAQGLGVMNEAAGRTASNLAVGTDVMQGNVRARQMAKEGAIQTGAAGQNLLTGAAGLVQSSQAARQAMASSIAAREAARGEGKAALWGGIGQLAGTLGGAAIGSFAGPAGTAAGAQLGGQAAGSLAASGAGRSNSAIAADYTIPGY